MDQMTITREQFQEAIEHAILMAGERLPGHQRESLRVAGQAQMMSCYGTYELLTHDGYAFCPAKSAKVSIFEGAHAFAREFDDYVRHNLDSPSNKGVLLIENTDEQEIA